MGYAAIVIFQTITFDSWTEAMFAGDEGVSLWAGDVAGGRVDLWVVRGGGVGAGEGTGEGKGEGQGGGQGGGVGFRGNA